MSIAKGLNICETLKIEFSWFQLNMFDYRAIKILSVINHKEFKNVGSLNANLNYMLKKRLGAKNISSGNTKLIFPLQKVIVDQNFLKKH